MMEEEEQKPAKCERCGNYLQICGHDLPFKERIKTVRANYSGWGPTK